MELLELPLTPARLETLKSQRFDMSTPGTLLNDFSKLIEIIGDKGVAVSKKNHLLGIKLLGDLNSRLSSPLEVRLKRPLQKSFPHINGLYLLLRASGLVYIKMKGKQAKLMLDGNALKVWNELNPTERYFSLFMAWCYNGSPEIIGERSSWEDNHFIDSNFFFKLLLNEKFASMLKREGSAFFRYRPGFHNLALLELFGFVEIERGIPADGEGWIIDSVKPTAWGEAFISFLSENMPFSGYEEEDEMIAWEKELKKHIPGWKNSLLDLLIDTSEEFEGYVFNVVLEGASRKFSVPADTRLHDLAGEILNAFAFDFDHLYEFIYKNRCGATEDIEGLHPYSDVDKTQDYTLKELPLYKGMEFTFHFDFGDDWMFNITVESASTDKKGFDELKLIEEKGTPPSQYPDWDEDSY